MIRRNQIVDGGVTRKRFIRAVAIATIAASFFPMLCLRGTEVAAQHPPSQSVPATKLNRTADHLPKQSVPATKLKRTADHLPKQSAPATKLNRTADHLPKQSAPATKLVPPASGKIPVAFIMERGAETIDFAGPWTVFQAVVDFSRGMNMEDAQVFQLYIVSGSTKPIRATGGMQIIPDYTYADAPVPKVVVVPGTGTSPEMLDWIRKATKSSDVVMSVCVGVYRLAEAGVLAGKNATINSGAYAEIQKKYPDVRFLLNRRWVQSDRVIFTSGPTGAGIDLALHIVELYFGREVATRTARAMNYKGQDWKGDGTDSIKDPLPSDQFSAGVLGNWQGKVMTKEGPLQLAIHIWPYQNGKQLVGAAEVTNQDPTELFIDPIVLSGSDLHFEINLVGSTYDGKLNAQGTAIEGTWKQNGASAPLVLKRVKK